MRPRNKTGRNKNRHGVLTLEWILIITVVVIGLVGGIGSLRTAVVGEMSDLTEAIEALNVKPEAECTSEGAAFPC